MMAFCPGHPKWDQNPKFTPLSDTTSIHTPFICGVPPPGLHTGELVRKIPIQLDETVRELKGITVTMEGNIAVAFMNNWYTGNKVVVV